MKDNILENFILMPTYYKNILRNNRYILREASFSGNACKQYQVNR